MDIIDTEIRDDKKKFVFDYEQSESLYTGYLNEKNEKINGFTYGKLFYEEYDKDAFSEKELFMSFKKVRNIIRYESVEEGEHNDRYAFELSSLDSANIGTVDNNNEISHTSYSYLVEILKKKNESRLKTIYKRNHSKPLFISSVSNYRFDKDDILIDEFSDIELNNSDNKKENTYFGYVQFNNCYYLGYFEDGYFNDAGLLVVDQTNELFFGCFSKGKKNGYGTLKRNRKVVYYGYWKDDLYDGIGHLEEPNSYSYTGVFKQGKKTLLGFEYCKNGSAYMGEYKENNRNGYGLQFIINPNKIVSCRIKGKWIDNKLEGLAYRIQKDKLIVSHYHQGIKENEEIIQHYVPVHKIDPGVLKQKFQRISKVYYININEIQSSEEYHNSFLSIPKEYTKYIYRVIQLTLNDTLKQYSCLLGSGNDSPYYINILFPEAIFKTYYDQYFIKDEQMTSFSYYIPNQDEYASNRSDIKFYNVNQYYCRIYSKSIYIGNMKNFNPEGFGMIIYLNNDSFIGSWKNGMKQGSGLFCSHFHQYSYYATWNNNLLEGNAIFYTTLLKTKLLYENNNLHPSGDCIYNDNSIYKGEIHILIEDDDITEDKMSRWLIKEESTSFSINTDGEINTSTVQSECLDLFIIIKQINQCLNNNNDQIIERHGYGSYVCILTYNKFNIQSICQGFFNHNKMIDGNLLLDLTYQNESNSSHCSHQFSISMQHNIIYLTNQLEQEYHEYLNTCATITFSIPNISSYPTKISDIPLTVPYNIPSLSISIPSSPNFESSRSSSPSLSLSLKHLLQNGILINNEPNKQVEDNNMPIDIPDTTLPDTSLTLTPPLYTSPIPLSSQYSSSSSSSQDINQINNINNSVDNNINNSIHYSIPFNQEQNIPITQSNSSYSVPNISNTIYSPPIQIYNNSQTTLSPSPPSLPNMPINNITNTIPNDELPIIPNDNIPNITNTITNDMLPIIPNDNNNITNTITNDELPIIPNNIPNNITNTITNDMLPIIPNDIPNNITNTITNDILPIIPNDNNNITNTITNDELPIIPNDIPIMPINNITNTIPNDELPIIPNDIPNNITNTITNDILPIIPNDNNNITNTITNDELPIIPNDIPNDIPDITNTITNDELPIIPNDIPNNITNTITNDELPIIPNDIPNNITNTIPNEELPIIPNDIPNNLPDISNTIPNEELPIISNNDIPDITNTITNNILPIIPNDNIPNITNTITNNILPIIPNDNNNISNTITNDILPNHSNIPVLPTLEENPEMKQSMSNSLIPPPSMVVLPIANNRNIQNNISNLPTLEENPEIKQSMNNSLIPPPSMAVLPIANNRNIPNNIPVLPTLEENPEMKQSMSNSLIPPPSMAVLPIANNRNIQNNIPVLPTLEENPEMKQSMNNSLIPLPSMVVLPIANNRNIQNNIPVLPTLEENPEMKQSMSNSLIPPPSMAVLPIANNRNIQNNISNLPTLEENPEIKQSMNNSLIPPPSMAVLPIANNRNIPNNIPVLPTLEENPEMKQSMNNSLIPPPSMAVLPIANNNNRNIQNNISNLPTLEENPEIKQSMNNSLIPPPSMVVLPIANNNNNINDPSFIQQVDSFDDFEPNESMNNYAEEEEEENDVGNYMKCLPSSIALPIVDDCGTTIIIPSNHRKFADMHMDTLNEENISNNDMNEEEDTNTNMDEENIDHDNKNKETNNNEENINIDTEDIETENISPIESTETINSEINIEDTQEDNSTIKIGDMSIDNNNTMNNKNSQIDINKDISDSAIISNDELNSIFGNMHKEDHNLNIEKDENNKSSEDIPLQSIPINQDMISNNNKEIPSSIGDSSFTVQPNVISTVPVISNSVSTPQSTEPNDVSSNNNVYSDSINTPLLPSSNPSIISILKQFFESIFTCSFSEDKNNLENFLSKIDLSCCISFKKQYTINMSSIIGLIVEIKTTYGETLKGEIFCYDDTCQTLVLKLSTPTNPKASAVLLKVQYIQSIKVLDHITLNEILLPHISSTVTNQLAEENEQKMDRLYSQLHSPYGMYIFDQINKYVPCKWEDEKIITGSVTISPPYYLNDMKGPEDSINRIKHWVKFATPNVSN
ncbi:hypothetical protein WA158_007375 [Blastocystis sp. Blastoise]